MDLRGNRSGIAVSLFLTAFLARFLLDFPLFLPALDAIATGILAFLFGIAPFLATCLLGVAFFTAIIPAFITALLALRLRVRWLGPGHHARRRDQHGQGSQSKSGDVIHRHALLWFPPKSPLRVRIRNPREGGGHLPGFNRGSALPVAQWDFGLDLRTPECSNDRTSSISAKKSPAEAGLSCSAVRVTLVGSRMPMASMSPYSPVAAL